MGGVTDKEAALVRILEGMGSVVVAFSGGVDSAYLAVAAHRVLGPRSLAVTADSRRWPRRNARRPWTWPRGSAFPTG